jgi:hypothetical protein
MLATVFATTTTTVSVGPGNHTTVHEGEHWLASDPIVVAHPDLFTNDPRHGLCSTVPIPDGDDEEPGVSDEWETAAKLMAEAGHTPDSAVAAVFAAEPPKADAEAATDDGKGGDDVEPQAPVEQATKAPGEKRTTRRRG